MANQMIALTGRPAQLPNLGSITARMGNVMANMAAMDKARREKTDADAIRAVMGGEGFKPTDADSLSQLIRIGPAGVDAAAKLMQAQKLGGDLTTTRQQQAEKRVGIVGAGLIGLLRDPSDENLAATEQTFKSVGMDPSEYQGVLKQISEIPDANKRKIFALQFIAQSEPARAALKYVMPDVKSEKIGDAQVYIDNNPGSPTFSQELFRITASPEPVKLNQQVVGETLYNVNPTTGVAQEATIGNATAGLVTGPRSLSRTDTGVVSPYTVGGAPSVGIAPSPTNVPNVTVPSVETNVPNVTAPSVGTNAPMGAPVSPRVGNLTVDRLRPVILAQESGGDYTKVSPKGALGAYQVMPATARSLAGRLGMQWRPELMTSNTREARQYQDAIGSAAIQEAISAGGGDLTQTAMYYHGGSNRNLWGPKTRQYAVDIANRLNTGNAPTRSNAPTRANAPAAGAPATPTTITEAQRQKAFRQILPIIGFDPKTGTNRVSKLIEASTSGGAEMLGSDLLGFVTGEATSGRVALGELRAIADNMTFEKLRGKLGAQISDADVRLIANTMADIANGKIPANERLAAWNNVVLPIITRGAAVPVRPAPPSRGAAPSRAPTRTKSGATTSGW